MIWLLASFYLNVVNRYRLLLPFIVVAGLLIVGTGGYMITEGWSPSDAFFMTVITLSTVGYGEIHNLDGAGRVFTSVLILGGLGLLSYSLTNVAAWFVEGQLTGGVVRQQVRRRIANLEHHVVVCGYGRVGESVSAQLAQEQVPVVVIEHLEDRMRECLRQGTLALQGDATQEETLVAAGIKRARGLVLALDDDTKNVFIALTGRALNPDLFIVSRAARPESDANLLRAGVDRVVSPFAMGAERMAILMTRPSVARFLESTLRHGAVEYDLEEFVLPGGAPRLGRPLAELLRTAGAQVTVLAVCGAEGLVTSEITEHVTQPGDTLIVIGDRAQLDRLRRACQISDEAG